MLYLIATPVGHLADFSFRSVETLQKCDYILCEDTRYSLRLLHHYQIKKRLRSFHAFNEAQMIEEVMNDLRTGAHIGLISDAGTPLLCDPGFTLVRRCKEEQVPFTALPGANAALLGLLHCGFPPLPFQCVGFLSKKASERALELRRILLYQGTTICYETPHRLLETLAELTALQPERCACVARELTKIHEESRTARMDELLSYYTEHPPRGELLLLVSPFTPTAAFEDMSTQDLVNHLKKEFSMTTKEAIKLAAELHRLPKRKVYQLSIEN